MRSQHTGISAKVFDRVVTKGVEIASRRAIALKKLITHNVRDGVRGNFSWRSRLTVIGIYDDDPRDQDPKEP